MPELPEVESVRAALDAALSGAVITKVHLARDGLRVPFPANFARSLSGVTIRGVRRRAKYLLFDLDSPQLLIVHLGMSGRFLVEHEPRSLLGKHDHVTFELTDGRQVIFNDARRFGLMTLTHKKEEATHPLLAGLGPEPLEEAFTPAYLRAKLERRVMAVKPVLMDQALVVGVGNIYASEALFLAGIDPRVSAASVAGHAAELVGAIRQVLKAAIASGGSSLRDFLHITGKEGHFQHHFNVYGRAKLPCTVCGEPIAAIRQAGRSSFFCPRCQQ